MDKYLLLPDFQQQQYIVAHHDHHHESRSTTNLHTTTSPHLPTSHANGKHIAIMGNGAKAASKRERNAKDAGNVAKSQLKSVGFCFLSLALLSRTRLASFPLSGKR